MSCKYIEALNSLVQEKQQAKVVGSLDSKYIIPYRRVLNVLQQAKCKVVCKIFLVFCSKYASGSINRRT